MFDRIRNYSIGTVVIQIYMNKLSQGYSPKSLDAHASNSVYEF